MIRRVAIIGAGRLAWSLIPNLQKAGIEVSQLISRDVHKLKTYQDAYSLSSVSTRFSDIKHDIDLLLLTVNDGAISSVAKHLATHSLPRDLIVAHTSGSIGLDQLSPLQTHTGVFYPLQIFTPHSITKLDHTPFFIEGKGDVGEHLTALATKLSSKVFAMTSKERLKLHMGAVMACNFSNLLYKIAQDQLPSHLALDLSVYEPLLRMTLEKALEEGPENTQTGPAVRGDVDTIKAHMRLLETRPEWLEMYRQLSSLINPDLPL